MCLCVYSHQCVSLKYVCIHHIWFACKNTFSTTELIIHFLVYSSCVIKYTFLEVNQRGMCYRVTARMKEVGEGEDFFF